jgi:hypothetical protein
MDELYLRDNIRHETDRSFFVLVVTECSGPSCEKNPTKIRKFFESFFVEMAVITEQIDWDILG